VYDDWARLREVAEDGCVLVRPDAHVGWRAATITTDPAGELRRVLEAILDRQADPVANPRLLALHSEETK